MDHRASSYSFDWIEDHDPRWDEDRETIFATVSDDLVPAGFRVPGRRLPGTWWRVKDGDTAVAQGWLLILPDRAVALLAVAEAGVASGAGGFGVVQLGREVGDRGFGRVVTMIRRKYPRCAAVTVWTLERETLRPSPTRQGRSTPRRDQRSGPSG